MVTFTLRNANDFAVKDIEIACTFCRPRRQPSDRPQAYHPRHRQYEEPEALRRHAGRVRQRPRKQGEMFGGNGQPDLTLPLTLLSYIARFAPEDVIAGLEPHRWVRN
jgi:hypothetical protein